MKVLRLLAVVGVVLSFAQPAAALSPTTPLGDLQARLSAASHRAPGHIGIAIEDLTTGKISGVNADVSMPAASTIKIPVMVEVFEQMSHGTIELAQTVRLRAGDKDWGWGDLCSARVGTAYPVSRLLWLMITDSDNTATNMLIRLVGRHNINETMHELGLRHTRVADYIRSEGNIRSLRSSATDMLRLLEGMAKDRLVDEWSSRQMVAILSGQRHNSLLPQPLPRDIKVAHKTGTLHDTLNDVGIVFSERDPYIIAVMTTRLPALDMGRRFIRGISRIAYEAMNRLADQRDINGESPLDRLTRPAAPEAAWASGAAAANTAPLPAVNPPAEPAADVSSELPR